MTTASPAMWAKYAAARRARNHAKALAEGRVPGWPGRHISTHPKAAYWRERARRRYREQRERKLQGQGD